MSLQRSKLSGQIPRLSLQYDLNTVLEGLLQRLKDKTVHEREKLDKRTLRTFVKDDLVSTLDTSWEGPYKVQEKLSDVTVVDGESDESIDASIIPDSFKGKDWTSHEISDLDNCFSSNPGTTATTCHHLKLTSYLPIWSPSYSIPLRLEKAFKSKLDNLLALGIIEPSTSQWSSPPIPILKKDGTVRIVVDFRKLNTMTISEPFLMPTTEEIIARLGNAKFLSKLDLCKGFHQVPMHPDVKHLTAFSCRYGKFQYKKKSPLA